MAFSVHFVPNFHVPSTNVDSFYVPYVFLLQLFADDDYYSKSDSQEVIECAGGWVSPPRGPPWATS